MQGGAFSFEGLLIHVVEIHALLLSGVRPRRDRGHRRRGRIERLRRSMTREQRRRRLRIELSLVKLPLTRQWRVPEIGRRRWRRHLQSKSTSWKRNVEYKRPTFIFGLFFPAASQRADCKSYYCFCSPSALSATYAPPESNNRNPKELMRA